MTTTHTWQHTAVPPCQVTTPTAGATVTTALQVLSGSGLTVLALETTMPMALDSLAPSVAKKFYYGSGATTVATPASQITT